MIELSDRTKTLYEMLHIPTDIEIFYKKLYEAEKDPVTLKQFFSVLDKDEIIRGDYIVPEWPETIENRNYSEMSFFRENKERNVLLRKHDCYTPVFIHTHSFFEFVYVLDGHCKQIIGGTEFGMEQGDFCLISPGIKHIIKVFDSSTIINILVRKSTFNDIFFNFLRKKNPVSAFFCDNLYSSHISAYLTFRTGNDKDLRELVLEMFTESESAGEYDLELLDYQVLILFTKILRDYGNTCSFPSPVTKDDARSSELLSYIRNNYQSISLTSVADRFRYTPEYTSRLIRKTTGTTFQQIVRTLKMERAKNFLTDTNVSVEEISRQIGYMNPEHFIRMFKKTFCMPPGEYRRRNSDSQRNIT